jgi:hypothetical protein
VEFHIVFRFSSQHLQQSAGLSVNPKPNPIAMKSLRDMNKRELIHELIAANTEVLFALKMHPADSQIRQIARNNLSHVVAEVERRSRLLVK